MNATEIFLREFEQEMANTRRLLEIVPEDEAAWKPHAKSWSLGDLSLHIANLPAWAVVTLTQSEFDMSSPAGTVAEERSWASTAQLLTTFDGNVADARTAIINTSDAALAEPWTLKSRGAPVFTMPRRAVLHTFVLSHLIHHRGQLTVYLRMCDVPLPSIYGPSADAAPPS
jgi:uncharacterized damage-inducible protein DinB